MILYKSAIADICVLMAKKGPPIIINRINDMKIKLKFVHKT